MPRKMSKLNQLHVLSSFVVGKHEDNGIEELGGLVNLHGSVEIKKLENIVDVNEAKRAKIMDMKHIDELCLQWSSGDDLVLSTQKERDILDNLQPQNGLKELEIKGYKGTIFPDWLGNCSYENMTRVSLKSCKNCCMLPSLGQLPSLKSLSIEGLDQLRSIGEEFYKNEGAHHSSRIAPFPSLESLEFDNMACWEVWHVSELPKGGLPPNLKELGVGGCEEQLRDLSWMANLHALTHLTINGYDCDNIKSYPEVGSLPHLPSLTTLKIGGFGNLETLECNEILSLSSLQQLSIQSCLKLENMAGEKLPSSLLLLKVDYCPFLGEHCKNKHQNIWPKISHIPTIQVGEYGWQKASFLSVYYFKLKSVLCLETVAAKLSIGPEEIDNCYGQGIAFFMDSTFKMCIRKLLWQLRLGEHLMNHDDFYCDTKFPETTIPLVLQKLVGTFHAFKSFLRYD
ncbi:hypothetical protein AHAS_Ahas02G0013600 [Arachis hypogaea]